MDVSEEGLPPHLYIPASCPNNAGSTFFRNVGKYRIFSNVIRTSFCRFLKQKKKLVRGSNPHLSFNRPLPTRQTDSVMSDDGESDE